MSLHPLVGTGLNAVRLSPGDVLLFSGHSPLSWSIRVKTWSHYSHAEIYVGLVCEIPTLVAEGWHAATPVVATAKRHSVVLRGLRALFRRAPLASDGVNYYPFDPGGLVQVARPRHKWARTTALQRFESQMRGQGYDTFGLLASFYACRHGRKNAKGFCSETVTRVLRWGNIEPFNEDVDADEVAPSDLAKTGELRQLDPFDTAEDAA